MHATVHTIDDIPGPQDTSWVDAALTRLRASAVPAGALVARPMGLGPGIAVAFWDHAADAADAAAAPYEVIDVRTGTSTGPARYLQLTRFDGPRTAEWAKAFDRAGEERIWPAVRDLPGTVRSLVGGTPDGGRLTLTLADSVEALEAGAVAIMSTRLLPWEDPADLTGPDAIAVLRLLHADLPLGADR